MSRVTMIGREYPEASKDCFGLSTEGAKVDKVIDPVKGGSYNLVLATELIILFLAAERYV